MGQVEGSVWSGALHKFSGDGRGIISISYTNRGRR
jgi:hypothetical protein